MDVPVSYLKLSSLNALVFSVFNLLFPHYKNIRPSFLSYGKSHAPLSLKLLFFFNDPYLLAVQQNGLVHLVIKLK